MQITFDPLVAAEADYVRNVLGGQTQTLTVGGVSAELTVQQMADLLRAGIQVAEEAASGEEPAAVRAEVAATIAQADRPDMGADAPSAAPLPPVAPLPAAADLFGTAPAAPTAGEASATPVPPPPVPTVPAPDAPTASAGSTLPAGTVDKDGLPHDPRIHSGTKVTNADGTWRKRRGVSDETVAQVEAELRALMAIPAPARPVSAVPLPPSAGTAEAPVATSDSAVKPGIAIPATEPATASPIAPSAAVTASPASTVPMPPAPPVTAPAVPAPPVDAGNVPALPTSAPATAPIPTPPVPPAPTAAADGAPPTFAGLMRKVSGHLTAKTLTPEQIDAAMESVRLTRAQMNLLAARPDLVEAVDAYINSLVMGGA